jgi:hypothetical protein
MAGAVVAVPEDCPSTFAAESMLLRVEKAHGALNVCQRVRPCLPMPLEHLATVERPFEVACEFFKVVLYDSVQAHQLAIDVVDDLNLG